jgi:hypothetical protein
VTSGIPSSYRTVLDNETRRLIWAGIVSTVATTPAQMTMWDEPHPDAAGDADGRDDFDCGAR